MTATEIIHKQQFSVHAESNKSTVIHYNVAHPNHIHCKYNNKYIFNVYNTMIMQKLLRCQKILVTNQNKTVWQCDIRLEFQVE